MKRKIAQKIRTVLYIIVFVSATFSAYAEDFLHPNDVVDKMKIHFKKIETYKAEFNIKSKEKNKLLVSKGLAYYKKGGYINFTFKNPSGDLIISNGKKMWVYIASLKAVGIQDLDVSSNSKNIYNAGSYEGLVNLFRRYHYRFDTPKQPVVKSKKKYFVLLLEEKEKSGGFETMLVYVDAKSYLISSIVASLPSGRQVTLEFDNIELNKEIPGNMFSYKLKPDDKVVENPLVTE
ncbi:MAG: outer membrane lipoprotein carrier protein LolA [Spirochaetia bacterium]|nr:outer membrane lipoprotein carrier protein LolA [Spirochaetia bacterium]